MTNLHRPGGNLTGITLDAGIEIWGKRLEFLKEAIPSMQKAVFLGMRGGWEGVVRQVLRDRRARTWEFRRLLYVPAGGETRGQLSASFDAIAEQRPDAVLVSRRGSTLYANRQLIAELAVKKRLPTICPYRDYVEAGRA